VIKDPQAGDYFTIGEEEHFLLTQSMGSNPPSRSAPGSQTASGSGWNPKGSRDRPVSTSAPMGAKPVLGVMQAH
jgi:hypothetical protein